MVKVGLVALSTVLVTLLLGCAATPSTQPNSLPPADMKQTVVTESVAEPAKQPEDPAVVANTTPQPEPKPLLTVAQAQAKLNALGFKVGAVDGKIGSKTRAALKNFQRKHGIAVTGELDDATSDKLSE